MYVYNNILCYFLGKAKGSHGFTITLSTTQILENLRRENNSTLKFCFTYSV